MSLPLSRYKFIRQRLIELYNILNNKTFAVFLTPKMLMNLDQLRDRVEYWQEGFVNDTHYFEDYQERMLKIPKIIDLLPNMVSEDELGFRNPNRVVPEIYESIQEYIQLWCELYRNAPEFPTPSMDELRKLELLAYTLFGMYKRIKPYLQNAEARNAARDGQEAYKRNLAALAGLLRFTPMGHDDDDGLSFISHLDEIAPVSYSPNDLSFNAHPVIATKAIADSLADNNVTHELGDWYFKG